MSYIIKYTDPLKTSFNVQPYTTNGRVNPTLAPLDPSAVSSNTSLIIYGKGMPEYGEGMAQNMLHLLENFASSTGPYLGDEVEGQLWYDNANFKLNIWEPAGPTPTVWSSVILDTGTAPMRGDFDLNNNRILNVPTTPTAVTDAINEQYVLDHAADADLHLTDEQNQMLDGMETILGLNLSDLDNKLTALSDFNTFGDTLTVQGALDVKADFISAPTNDNIVLMDAIGNIKDSGAQLSDFGAAVHTHPAADITFAGPYGNLIGTDVQAVIEELDDEKAPIASPTFTGIVQMDVGARLYLDADPTLPLEAATLQWVIAEVAGVTGATQFATRKLVTSTGVSTYFPPPFTVGRNKLEVFVNGQKYYANGRGFQEVYVIDDTSTGLANDATVYTFNIDVDGSGVQVINIVGNTAQSFDNLIAQINGFVVGATVERNNDLGVMTFISNNQDTPGSSTIVVTDVNLFSSLSANSLAIVTADTGSDFFEIDTNYLHLFYVGATFNVSGSTGNDGGSPYTVTSSSYIPATDRTRINVAAVASAVGDGNIIIVSDILPAVAGSSQGYYELGTVDDVSASITFNATVPSIGQIIEFITHTSS